MSLILIGQFVEPGSARHTRVEVLVDRPPAKSDDAPLVYLTKYADGQIGERSMGISLAAARHVAQLLIQTADAWGPAAPGTANVSGSSSSMGTETGCLQRPMVSAESDLRGHA